MAKYKKSPNVGTLYIQGRLVTDTDIVEGGDELIPLVRAGLLVPVVEKVEKKDKKTEKKE
jgi:hypothetical protein